MKIRIACKGSKTMPIGKLKEFQGELKSLSDEDYKRLRKVIEEVGFSFPVAVWKGNILDGHQRLRVVRKMLEEGYTIGPIPVVEIEAKDEAEAKRKLLAAASAYGKIEKQGLYEFMSDAKMDFGELSMDFKLPEIDMPSFEVEFFKEPTKVPSKDPDEAPAVPKVILSKLGDVWTLGKHRVLCGDATSIDAVEKLMSGKKADMVFTDPPYNTGMTKKTNSGSTWLSHMFEDAFTDEEWNALLSGMCANYWSATKDDAALYVCLDWRRSHELVEHLKKVFKFSNLIVWDKVVHGLGSDYQYTHEFIHVCKKGKPEIDSHQGDKEYQDVWRIQRVIGRDEEHATKKPIELVERSLRHASKKDGIVLDLFGGSGSTLIACEKTERICMMMELLPAYIDVILNRWSEYTGKDPVRDDGVKWSALKSKPESSQAKPESPGRKSRKSAA